VPAYAPPVQPLEEPVRERAVEQKVERKAEPAQRKSSGWFALRGDFVPKATEHEPPHRASREGQKPVTAVFSLAGGVGKTSLVATLGRALSSSGERALLVWFARLLRRPARRIRQSNCSRWIPQSTAAKASMSLPQMRLSARRNLCSAC
jgi:predicted GTPase